MSKLNFLNDKNIVNLLQALHDGVLITDNEGIVRFVNCTLEKYFHLNKEEIVGKNVKELIEAGVYSKSAAHNVCTTAESKTILTTRELKTFLAKGTPVFDKKGKLEFVVINIWDVTKINELKIRLEQRDFLESCKFGEIAAKEFADKDINGIIAVSSEMKEILTMTELIADVDATILITGESGTGKEVVANRIYESSVRNSEPMIKINCGAIPKTILESELFGYEEGAFTGARKKGKVGYFQLAHKGTLFLDEIGELDINSQVKLLRVIQEREFYRVGGEQPIKINVRIIAATNVDLWKLVEEGKFRQDLYWRLSVITIDIPPLRERREDIIPLAQFFLKKYNKKYHRDKKMAEELMKWLYGMDWPGNIRELSNLIENMVVLTRENCLLVNHIPRKYRVVLGEEGQITVKGILKMKEAVEKVESQLIYNARKRYKGTREIAQILGVAQSTISRKIRKYEND